jgi:hypothetical protein
VRTNPFLFLPLFLVPFRIACAQDTDVNGNKRTEEISSSFRTAPQFEISTISFSQFRLLSEINNDTSADAYPCLSRNGLRVYFTRGDFNIYVSTRNPVTNTFSPPILVFNYTEPMFSCLVSPDEKTMIATVNPLNGSDRLIRATRSSLWEAFSFHSGITVHPENTLFTSPSFSPDSNELYLFTEDSSLFAGKTRRYLRSAGNGYVFDSNFPSSPTGRPGPGRLTSDGLTFFGTVESTNRQKIYRWHRSSLSELFNGTPELVNPGPGSDTLFYSGQPSVAEDQSFMVYVANKFNRWKSNNLAIAINPTTNTLKSEKGLTVLLYPNPANGRVRVSNFNGNPPFQVFSLCGKSVCRGEIPSDGFLDLSALAPGIYTLQVWNNGGWVREKLVKE